MVYVYAVTEPMRDAPARAGLAGAALRLVTVADLAAVVSDHADAPLHAAEDSLWAHERVVEDLMSDRAVLPMRFGSVLRDDAAVRETLAARRAHLSAALQRVSGAVELGVRAAWNPDTAGVARDVAAGARSPGAAYLLGLAQRSRHARTLAERLDRAVAGLCRARVQRLLRSPSLPVSAAYLVDRTAVEPFRSAIVALDAQLADAQIVCTGPWPPYSFSGTREP